MAQSTQHNQQNKERGGLNNPGGQGNQGFAPGSQGITDTAKDMACSFTESAKGAAAAATKSAGDAASFVGKKVEGATTAVGGSMKSLAGTIREGGPHEGILGDASNAVASTLESSGRYLEEHGLSGIGEDMTSLIRRNPIPAVLIGIGVGFLIARASRA